MIAIAACVVDRSWLRDKADSIGLVALRWSTKHVNARQRCPCESPLSYNAKPFPTLKVVFGITASACCSGLDVHLKWKPSAIHR
jgi:hypothetical protein